MSIRLLGLMALAGLVSCQTTTVCPADLIVGVAPNDTTIAPGDQFATRVTLLGCGGTKTLTDSLTWTSSDVTVAVVGTHTGVVIGVHPGSAVILVSAKTYGAIGDAHVTVR